MIDLKQLKKDCEELADCYGFLKERGFSFDDLDKKPARILNFRDSRIEHLKARFLSAFKSLKNTGALIISDPERFREMEYYDLVLGMSKIFESMDYSSDSFEDDIKKIKDVSSKIEIKEDTYLSISNVLRKIPTEIRDEISEDIREMNKCFDSGCYRSVTILCGRVLEAALHRVYYNVTGNDLLEKSPGIGLGNIIGKLSDKDVKFDPGLTQQIHLINQIRIFSVHKKKDVFRPNKAQAQAMMIYTLDILSKVF